MLKGKIYTRGENVKLTFPTDYFMLLVSSLNYKKNIYEWLQTDVSGEVCSTVL